MNRQKQHLTYFYDKEADVFYFSMGTPSTRDEVTEAGDDVLVRQDPRTKRIRGFTLLNASKRTNDPRTTARIPFALVPMS